MRTERNLEGLCRDILNGAVSPDEIRERCLYAEADLGSLNCFIREGDAGRQFGRVNMSLKGSPLWAIPVSFKDNICVKGMPVTAGTPGMTGCIASHDAFIVRKLKSLGAIVAGKNNMHELSFGITSVNTQWGTVGNPAAAGYCAGGSSGGGAAAVAAGIVCVAVGTDTGGSVRIPAAFCGIVGFRPTSGRWSSAGIIPVSHTKDSPGLFTRTVADTAFLYDMLAGPRSSSLQRKSLPSRIGLPASLWSGLDEKVMKHCLAAINRLAQAGFECIEIDDGELAALNETITFTVPLYEFFTDFPRALFSLGWESRISSVFDNIADPNVRNIIHANMGGGLISPAQYAIAIINIGKLRSKVAELFIKKRIDVLAYPTVPCCVPRIRDAANPALFARVIRNTDLSSNAALPSISLPVAAKGELPVGLNLDAAQGNDRLLLSMAASIEKLLRA